MAYKQDERVMVLHTPLGEDVLLIQGLSGTEGLSRLFSFDLTLFSENSSIAFEGIIGKNVTVSMILPDDSERYFNGIVSYFSQKAGAGEENPNLTSYHATMVPWLWLLGRTTDYRIFQNLSVPEIIEKISRRRGLPISEWMSMVTTRNESTASNTGKRTWTLFHASWKKRESTISSSMRRESIPLFSSIHPPYIGPVLTRRRPACSSGRCLPKSKTT